MKSKSEIKEIFELDVEKNIHKLDKDLYDLKIIFKKDPSNSIFSDSNTIFFIKTLEFKIDEYKLKKLNDWSVNKVSEIVSNERYKDSLLDFLSESACFKKINNNKDLISEKSNFQILVDNFRIEFEKEKKNLVDAFVNKKKPKNKI